MKKFLLSCALILFSNSLWSQPPQRPLLPLHAWTLPDYQPVDVNKAFDLPADLAFSQVAALAMNAQGHLIVLHRGSRPFLEFDENGTLIRSFGQEGMFIRSHGLHLDDEDNMWVTDVSGHVVMKLDSEANILLTLGTPGEAGEWNEDSGSRRFDQPNEVALDSAGNIYVVQGHGPAEPKVLKFDPQGNFLMQWGSRGDGPGQFAVAHSIEIDAQDRVYVADRENFRVQIFDSEGVYLSEWNFNAMACGIYLHDDGFMYMTTGFDGEFAKLDMDGNIIGSLGRPGSANGEFGEAHYLVLNSRRDIFVADVVNRRVQKYQTLD